MDTPKLDSGLLRVSERFVSRQGEGKLTGTHSSFLRLSGCNLRCWFCDTPYASWEPDGQFEQIDELVRWVVQAGPTHVVLTGGEPLLPMKVVQLCREIRAAGLHLTIETAGTVFRPVECDLMSISPKLSASTPTLAQFPNHHEVMAQRWIEAHHRRRWQPDVIHQLIAVAEDFQIKFVVDKIDERDEIEAAIAELSVPREQIWIMPQAASPEQLDQQTEWVSAWCRESGLNFCDRAHLRWYGAVRGT